MLSNVPPVITKQSAVDRGGHVDNCSAQWLRVDLCAVRKVDWMESRLKVDRVDKSMLCYAVTPVPTPYSIPMPVVATTTHRQAAGWRQAGTRGGKRGSSH